MCARTVVAVVVLSPARRMLSNTDRESRIRMFEFSRSVVGSSPVYISQSHHSVVANAHGRKLFTESRRRRRQTIAADDGGDAVTRALNTRYA